MQGLEDPVLADRLGDAVPDEIRVQKGVYAREHEAHFLALQFVDEVAERPRCGIVDVENGGAVDDEPSHRLGRVGHKSAHLIGEAVGVGVEEVGAEPVDDEAWIGREAGSKRLPPFPAAGNQHHRKRSVAVADMADERGRDRQEDSLLDADRRHRGRSEQSQIEIRRGFRG